MACINEYISLFGGEPHKAWQRCNADSIVCQRLANNIVDWYITDGKVAIQIVCRLLGVNGSVLGGYAIGAINKANSQALIEAIRHERLLQRHNSRQLNKLRERLNILA